MLRKAFSLFFTFHSQHATDKTVPESELEPNPKPVLKPNQEPEVLEPNALPKEDVDPIAMLAALPKTSNRKDRFNPRLSPIREEESSEYMLSEGNIAYTIRHSSLSKWLKKQIMCSATEPDYAYKPNNARAEEKKLPCSVVCLFKPNCGGLSSKPNHCHSTDIISSLRIFKARYKGGATRVRHLS